MIELAGGEGLGHARRSRTAASTTAPAPRPGATGGRPRSRPRPGTRGRSLGPRPRRSSWRSAGRSRARRPSSAGRSGSSSRPAPPAPSGISFRRARASAKRDAVAPEHLDIGQQMVAEGHRLRRLQVGEARHHRARRARSASPSSAAWSAPRCASARSHRVAHPEAEVGRDLVVARARGVQPAARLADQLGQPRLDVQVDVLEPSRNASSPASISRRDPLEAVQDPAASAAATMPQRPACGRAPRSPRCPGPQPLVEADRGVNLLHEGCRAGPEMAAPQVAPGLRPAARHPHPRPCRTMVIAHSRSRSWPRSRWPPPPGRRAARDHRAEALPDLRFQDMAGNETGLDAFSGDSWCSTSGPRGACPAARRCRPSTGSRRPSRPAGPRRRGRGRPGGAGARAGLP